jgi:kumamolisin
LYTFAKGEQPMFHPYYKFRRFKHSTVGVSYTPKQLANIYGFPKGYDGAGRKAAVIELGGGFVQADLDHYFHSLGLTVKPVVAHSVDGGLNSPGDPNGADGEVMLDLCVIGAMAPGVELHCYFAPNTDVGFLHAIQKAIADRVDVISISWGAAENQWGVQTMHDFDAAFLLAAQYGILVTAAAGDNGSGDGEPGQHVDFPASSPHVLACGGTSLPSLSPLTEVVWNDGSSGGATGGGVSAVFPLPDYQKRSNVPGSTRRGVPDVAGNADPETGWIVIIDGQDYVIGGTSAVAPMWAALGCVLSQAVGRSIGNNLQSVLYQLAGWSRDVISGNNGTYTARPGYDCCTGLGVPVGTKLLAVLQSLTAPAPPPAPTPPAPPPPAPVPPPPAPTTPKTHTIVVTGGTVTIDGKPV